MVLRGGQSALTVRNYLFVNGSGAGISVSCPFGVFENNVVLNVSGWALGIRADGPGPWTVQNNQRRAVADAAFASFEGNTLDLPILLVDPVFADVAPRPLFALPSRIAPDHWTTVAKQLALELEVMQLRRVRHHDHRRCHAHPVAILVRCDTSASKLLGRAAPTDKFTIRGIAPIPRDPGALTIVADTAEAPSRSGSGYRAVLTGVTGPPPEVHSHARDARPLPGKRQPTDNARAEP